MALPIVSRAQDLVITVAPPELPVYEQPAIPEPGYIWTPGYWAYSRDGYYWVPGTWVEPPSVGLLWTPANRPVAAEAARCRVPAQNHSSETTNARQFLVYPDQSLRPCTQCSSICSAIARSSSDALLMALL